MDIDLINTFRNKVHENISKVILGKSEVIDLLIMSAVCMGHVLIEDVPGTGKTMLAKCLAKSLEAKFSRIQFTPDMLPSDVTGLSIYNQASKEFEFRPGPINANIVLADEINRATPKTQSALLEAMEEKQVTVDGKTHHLPYFFMVIATQNPIDFEGTFTLPEAQLDRFLIRLKIEYPDEDAEMAMVRSQKLFHPFENIKPVTEVDEIIHVQKEIKTVFVSDKIEKYIVSIINRTRDNEGIYLGASPRGSLALYRLGQCRAAFLGRNFVTPDDIKYVSPYVLAHRIIPAPSTRLADFESKEIVEELISRIPVPGG
jgi:MoxR-like ATPase